MPRKKKSTNKSKIIRDFVTKNPSMMPKDVAAALSKNGAKISAQYVSTILSVERRKNGIAKKTGIKRSVRASKPLVRASSNGVALADVKLVKQLVADIGSLEKAIAAMNEYEQLVS